MDEKISYLGLAALIVEMKLLTVDSQFLSGSREDLWKKFVVASTEAQRFTLTEDAWKRIDKELDKEALKSLIPLVLFNLEGQSDIRKSQYQVLEDEKISTQVIQYMKEARNQYKTIEEATKALSTLARITENEKES
ncbi:MAG: hypothetical protein AABY26_01635 [Nanoarchaeota archaeon]